MEIDYDKVKFLNNINIIDIREHYLYQRNHINNSINIPLRVLRDMPDKYLSKDKEYYLICETGFNSKRLSNKLNNMGYKTYSIKNGYENS